MQTNQKVYKDEEIVIEIFKRHEDKETEFVRYAHVQAEVEKAMILLKCKRGYDVTFDEVMNMLIEKCEPKTVLLNYELR